MAKDKRVLIVESDESLGQFLDVSIEQFLGVDANVEEIDPNIVPDDLL